MRTFHYASIYDLDDWLNLGWIVTRPNAVMHHHVYSLVLEWLCDCKIARPK